MLVGCLTWNEPWARHLSQQHPHCSDCSEPGLWQQLSPTRGYCNPACLPLAISRDSAQKLQDLPAPFIWSGQALSFSGPSLFLIAISRLKVILWFVPSIDNLFLIPPPVPMLCTAFYSTFYPPSSCACNKCTLSLTTASLLIISSLNSLLTNPFALPLPRPTSLDWDLGFCFAHKPSERKILSGSTLGLRLAFFFFPYWYNMINHLD